MSYDDQRRHYEQLTADRRVVEQAAAHLRHQAILDAYAGLEHKHLAFALALILDELARTSGNCTATFADRPSSRAGYYSASRIRRVLQAAARCPSTIRQDHHSGIRDAQI